MHPDRAHLEWRTGRDAEFVEFKETHAIKFGEQFERGVLDLGPESLSAPNTAAAAFPNTSCSPTSSAGKMRIATWTAKSPARKRASPASNST